jgi:predicted small metal-binding protein
MVRELKCRDAGNDCDQVIRAHSDEEVMEMAAVHASVAHPNLDLTPEVQEKMRGLIHEAPPVGK